MTTATRSRALRALTWATGVTVAAVTALLIADLVAERRRAPTDAERIAVLEEQVRTDADAAAELADERQRQTERSLARETRNLRLGWLLLASAAVFLTGAKRLLRSSPSPSPPSPYPPIQPSRLGGREGTLKSPLDAGGRVGAPLSRAAVKGGRETGRGRGDENEPPLDLAFVDQLVARRGRDPEATIPLLQQLQAHYRYLPDEALQRLCELTEITPARIAGVAGFYARFRRSPVGEHMVQVCHGTACHVAGIEHVDDELRRRLSIPPGADTDPRRRFTLEAVACLGCCSLAPVMMIGDDAAGHLTPASAWQELLRRVPS